MSPQPWARTGPGRATDGKAKFDLTVFDPSYFERLRERAITACDEGIYVSVMLFEGFSLHLSAAPINVEGHPFYAANNVNGIGILSVDDYQVLPLSDAIRQLQESYIERVVATVQDIPNVPYEVANESPGGGSVDPKFAKKMQLAEAAWGNTTQWQYWVIDYLKQYEHRRRYQTHPVGMTMQYPVVDQRKVNEPLWASNADWISPGFDDPPEGAPPDAAPSGGRWLRDPPPNDGRKVVISDTDHHSPFQTDASWAWKSFLRGHNPILYDLGIISGFGPQESPTGVPPYQALEPARQAMGDTLRFATRPPLGDMVPRGELASTTYVLASIGCAYLVLQPSEGAEPFTLKVAAGEYDVEWFSVQRREGRRAEGVSVDGDRTITFRSPFADGASVLHLSATRQ